jgi:hypothetical protein
MKKFNPTHEITVLPDSTTKHSFETGTKVELSSLTVGGGKHAYVKDVSGKAQFVEHTEIKLINPKK